MTNSEEKYMLYIGAFDDMYPLQRFAHQFQTFIYVDVAPHGNHFQPGTPGYELSSSEDVFISTIINRLTQLKCFKSHECPKPLQHEFHLTGGGKIIYFMGIKDTEMQNHPDLAKLLPFVTALYAAGYTPVIKCKLPSLDTFYRTVFCGLTLENVTENHVDYFHTPLTEFKPRSRDSPAGYECHGYCDPEHNEGVLCRNEPESESESEPELELELKPECECREESQVDFNENHHCESDNKKIEFKLNVIKSNYESIVKEKKEMESDEEEESDEESDEESEEESDEESDE